MLTTDQHKAFQCRCFRNWKKCSVFNGPSNTPSSLAFLWVLQSSSRKPKCWLDFSEYLGLHILCKVKRWVLFSIRLSLRSWHPRQEDRHLGLLLQVCLKSRIQMHEKFTHEEWRNMFHEEYIINIRNFFICKTILQFWANYVHRVIHRLIQRTRLHALSEYALHWLENALDCWAQP